MPIELSKILEKGRSLVPVSKASRRVALRLARPVALHARKAHRPAILLLEMVGGVLILGGVLFALLYGRLSQGPVSLSFLVPTLEESINRELSGYRVRIDDFVMEKGSTGGGLSLRLRNVRLIDQQGAVVAQAPAAAVGLSGRALLAGRLAPGSVDFIGPRLLLFHTRESGLSLTFSREAGPSLEEARSQLQGEGKTPPAATGGAPAQPSARRLEPGIALIAPARQINLTRTITDAFGRARRHEDASSFLTRFGIRDAFVVFDQGGRQSYWQVPDFSIDLEHRQKRSTITGDAQISSSEGPWTFRFKTEEKQKRKSLTFTALIEGLIPSGIAANFPDLPALQAITLPVNAKTSIHLTTAGELVSADAKLTLSRGFITPPWDRKHPMEIDGGELRVVYRARENRIEILPSTLKWGKSHATVSGEFTPVEGQGGAPAWSFRLNASDAILAATEFGLPAIEVERWEAEGVYHTDPRRLDLSRFIIEAGGGTIELAGSVIDAPGSPAVRLGGLIRPMPVSILKQFWPKFIAAGAREWVGERVHSGQISGGILQINMPGGMLAALADGGDIPDSALQFSVDATDLEMTYLPGLPAMKTGAATLKISGRKFTMTVPEGRISLPSGKRIALAKGQLRVDDLRPDPQTGIIEFTAKGPAAGVTELLDHKPLEYMKAIGLKRGALGGQVSGHFRFSMPLVLDLDFEDIKLEGTALLSEASAKGAFGRFGIEGGSVEFNVTEKALEARGDILLNGVPALLSWQRLFGAAPERQPELRITAILNEDARRQLGLDINHMLRGSVPVVLGVRHGRSGKPRYRVRADLGSADLIVAAAGWRKPPGTPAVLSFDVGENRQGHTELQNFTIEGRDIGIKGWIALGPNDAPRAFYFPDFSFNVVTQIEIAGELNKEGIWEIQAHGSAYDGRQFFTSLFSAGKLSEEQQAAPQGHANINLSAKIGAVVGHFNTTVNDVSVRVEQRGGRLTALSMNGLLEGKAPIAAKLVSEAGQPRIILAESEDAGSAFRLVGFYPRVSGGAASLQVNLDAAGPTGGSGTAGILWAKDFDILGDRVVSEVVASGAEDSITSFGEQKRRMEKPQRQKIHFNQLRVPFSVGGGRFQLHDSYINGPQLGATIRGLVDFNTDRIHLQGTYIPVYGLNSALGQIPIIGDLLVGRRGEGVLGITFVVTGNASQPAVKINPVSAVAPGIFRQIFEFTGRQPRDLPRSQRPRAENKDPTGIGADYQN
ncbi:MAG: hypothetical protein Kow0032_23570 [Methyloligellaceae bacterium]